MNEIKCPNCGEVFHTEYISIMFEMKNEADETKTKHKNEGSALIISG